MAISQVFASAERRRSGIRNVTDGTPRGSE
jgi:hypothetical protein